MTKEIYKLLDREIFLHFDRWKDLLETKEYQKENKRNEYTNSIAKSTLPSSRFSLNGFLYCISRERRKLTTRVKIRGEEPLDRGRHSRWMSGGWVFLNGRKEERENSSKRGQICQSPPIEPITKMKFVRSTFSPPIFRGLYSFVDR